MPKYKQPANAVPESVETAWRDGGEIAACRAIIIKYAKVLDMTDSGRDIKPLASGLFETIDRLRALEAQDKSKTETPLFRIVKKAANE
jgi:hypothetical protein